MKENKIDVVTILGFGELMVVYERVVDKLTGGK